MKLETFKLQPYLICILFGLILIPFTTNAQGVNFNLLLGYNSGLDSNTTSTRARLLFDTSSVTLIPETKKMPFMGTQANIADENGNLLISTNGCWIANTKGDTMLNGAGLNPGSFTSDWCTNYSGMPIPHGDVIVPYPGDTSKYVLFHQTGDYNNNLLPSAIFYTVIDMSLDSSLGGVISNKKNLIAVQDTFSFGIAACQHANGRDWWIIALKDSTDIIFKILLTPNGIASVMQQSLGVPIAYQGEGQPTFSPDGSKFAYTDHSGPLNNSVHDARLFDFDRCSGIFSNPKYINLFDKKAGLGLAFSSNSKYLYACSFKHVFQMNTDSTVINVDTVAKNDGYASPNPPFYTDFWTMYLAANGKIYISTGNGTLDLHYIDFPDSGGVACDVQQHALHLPCYSGRADVNHPNYYLGRLIGSPCDTVWQGILEQQHDFRFRIYPNPISNNSLNIGYLLPQNRAGVFSIIDITGKVVFKYNLPQWSNEQSFNLPNLSNGVYSCVVASNGYRVSKKLVVIK